MNIPTSILRYGVPLPLSRRVSRDRRDYAPKMETRYRTALTQHARVSPITIGVITENARLLRLMRVRRR